MKCRPPILEVYPSRTRGRSGFRFRVVGRNGEPMAPSQLYTRRRDAVRGGLRVSPGAEVRYAKERG